MWECPRTPGGRDVYQRPCPSHPQASTVPWAPHMARHPKLGASRVLLLGCRGGSPGTPRVLSAGGHPGRGSRHFTAGTEGPSVLGAAQGWGCSVVQATWAVELSSEMSTGITQPNLSAFPSPWDPHPQQPRSSSSVPSGGGQALGVDGRRWKPWICVSAAPAAPAP